ncbi:hypothetical protein [Amycolatopsis sp. NBC_01480]|uniref:hypothetical protein n=1 Tax=Amycolatopsis sp. NBC_01480 TaxID=2903562 RepID=UPI002E2D7659|nr:hypothetical protein [Amycolatopsis sp. NBC_01480]
MRLPQAVSQPEVEPVGLGQRPGGLVVGAQLVLPDADPLERICLAELITQVTVALMGFRQDLVRAPGENPYHSRVASGNDLALIGAISKPRELGLDVSGDISGTGSDDIVIGRHVLPAFATATTPRAELGRRAWSLMLSGAGLACVFHAM